MSTELTVTGVEPVTPAIRRVWFHSDDLSAFSANDFTDRYVKLVFPKPGISYPEPLDLKKLRGILPPEELPDVRTYTALFPDVESGTLAIDFVIHGDEGIAGPWAVRARPGDVLLANGPGGAYRPDPSADWHLLVGDESAVPAIVAALSALPGTATARVLVLVEDAASELPLDLTPGSTATFVHRRGERPSTLLDALRDVEWLPGRVDAFVHGEAAEVMHGIRPFLFNERGLAREHVSISGYWRRGRTEAGFRDWKAELAQAERAQGEERPRG